MITQTRRNAIRQRIHARIRQKLSGTGVRPRLNVYRSLNHIYAQVIDDLSQKTLVSAADIEELLRASKAPKKERAKLVGAAIAKKCLAQGIDKVVFDRAGYKYHGRVSALADGAREAGLKF